MALMDPNEVLRQLRELVKDCEKDECCTDREAELCGLLDSLDQWLSSAGFMPDDWRPER